MIKRFSILAIFTSIVASHALILEYAIAASIIQYMMETVYYPKTYIASINTPTYGNYIKQSLEEFSNLENPPVLKFDKIENGRPITIEEVGPEEMVGYVGLAYPSIDHCKIKLNNARDYATIREVAIHEVLHCYGFDDVDDPKDVMNAYVTHTNKEENIKGYARKLRKYNGK